MNRVKYVSIVVYSKIVNVDIIYWFENNKVSPKLKQTKSWHR